MKAEVDEDVSKTTTSELSDKLRSGECEGATRCAAVKLSGQLDRVVLTGWSCAPLRSGCVTRRRVSTRSTNRDYVTHLGK